MNPKISRLLFLHGCGLIVLGIVFRALGWPFSSAGVLVPLVGGGLLVAWEALFYVCKLQGRVLPILTLIAVSFALLGQALSTASMKNLILPSLMGVGFLASVLLIAYIGHSAPHEQKAVR